MPNSADIRSSGNDELLARLQEAEQKVIGLSEELARSERLATLGMTAAIVAHEFNNILTPVLSYAQLAQASQSDVNLVSEALQRTIEAVVRATEIGSSILGFASADGVKSGPARVSDCVDAALRCMIRSPERDGVRVRVDIPDDMQAAISPVTLQQVLLNLILNACQSMQPSSGSLTISGKCSTWNKGEKSDQASVILEIADTGPGMAPELAAKVFEPFVTSRKGSGGNGLGLAVCKRLIEDAGGAIQLDSKPGIGTTFSISLLAAPTKKTTPQRTCVA